MNRRSFVLSALKSGVLLRSYRSLLSLLPAPTSRSKQARVASPFVLKYGNGRLTSLRYKDDVFPTDYIAPRACLGNIDLAVKTSGASEWTTFHSASSRAVAGKPGVFRISGSEGEALEVEVQLVAEGPVLRWSAKLRNLGSAPLVIGDLAFLLPMHSSFSDREPPTASVLKHHFISGDSSFLFWMRSNSVGPYLLMTPMAGTSLEYWDTLGGLHKDQFRVFAHSGAVEEQIRENGGRWRQPHSTAKLAPAGSLGSHIAYQVQFEWAPNYEGVRQRLVDMGKLDVEIAGGMNVPLDLSTTVALRSSRPVESVTAEHAAETTIELQPEKDGWALYRVTFRRLGENLLTIRQRDGATTRLEFFCSEPLETLIKKRAAFIQSHQVRDPAKWYNGLFAEWNLETEVQLCPDNYDRIKGWRIYEVTCDDPGLSKPAYLSTKNAEHPNLREIEALDYYIEHFVWGGLQRTTEESDSFGIYGIPDWKTNRTSLKTGNDGQRHIWRAYDYPHIVVLYHSMYRIASLYPKIPTRLGPEQYLDRAYGTALGLFTIPMRVTGWSAYETGFYNEAVIPDLIDDLDAAGRHEEAATLRGHWEKKVAFFTDGNPNLFGSEYAFDSTGFESTGVIARYVREHPHSAGTTAEGASKFSLRQIRANLFCRGVLEKAYYYYGSDYRGGAGNSFTLSYMSPMGGSGVLDHALHDGRDPDATLRLAYASLVSTWSLMNTGMPASGFGYWFPGRANDGGTGGGFEPAAYGETWLQQPHHRGPWYYSSETDLGYCGALRNACTIVVDDAIFGLCCMGGSMEEKAGALLVVPHDGVRRRLHVRTPHQRVDLILAGARFAHRQPVHIGAKGLSLELTLETELAGSGRARIDIAGLPAGKYHLRIEDAGVQVIESTGAQVTTNFPIAPGSIRALMTLEAI